MEYNQNIKKEIIKTNQAWNDKIQTSKYFEIVWNKFMVLFQQFKKNKDKVKILIPIAILSIFFMIYMIISTAISVRNLNKDSQELYSTRSFNTKLLEKSTYTENLIKSTSTIDELIDHESVLSKEISRYNDYLSKLQGPYEHFTKHIFLPNLNIRKDPFMWDINIDIIWAKFLEKNPYQDIRLIEKWSSFIKNVGNNNEFNQIENITIGDIIEKDDLFYIPINIKFIANSKRSFLLLVEKLSTTSNQKNIALINEFVYFLRENIKEEKTDIIEKLQDKNKNLNIDEEIWYHVYKRIFEDKENLLITNDIINKTIKDIIICENEQLSLCFYKFRDKYRSIPSLAYTVGLEENQNKTNDLKKFLKELPPIIKINQFTFDRNMQQNIKNYENIQYKWEIQIDIYWKGIDSVQVQEISDTLWQNCLWVNLNPDSALKKINDTLINIWENIRINTYNTSNLRELQNIIENIKKEYNNLNHYHKVIKLFEIYRMMKDGNLCNI